MFNIIQYDDGVRPIYAKFIGQVKSHIPTNVIHTLIKKSNLNVRNGDYRALSEIVRLTYAASNPYMVWLDSDVLIKKWVDFDLKPGKPYKSKTWNEAIFFVNGCCDFFQKLLDEYNNNNEEIYKPCWLRQMFLDHESEFEMIPDGYFVHLAMSQAILAGNNFDNCGNNDYNLYKDKNDELQFEIRFK